MSGQETQFKREPAIHRGDCLKLLADWPAGVARLVFADPPFNIGYIYKDYDDARSYRDYVEWSRRWVAAAVRSLTPDGSLYIAIGDDYAAELRVIGRELGLTLRNWIIWHYDFGQATSGKFARAHTHILYFVRDARRFVFNDELLRSPSARHTQYGDRRANPAGRLPDDVWTEYPRVCGTFKERQGWHGCQMPEALLARIITASSEPGDVVLDPFSGSGTTAATAVAWGRIGVGIEQSEEFAAAGRKRLRGALERAAAWRRPGADGWSEFERETLRQLYRETEVALASLLANAAAMACVALNLARRCGREIAVETIAAELGRLDQRHDLPRFRNDRPYRAKRHRLAEATGDRKLKPAWFRGMSARLKRANELGQSSDGDGRATARKRRLG
ncbi:MAG: site-specific DNA-methyltransferase [Phycisphaerae bacterium]